MLYKEVNETVNKISEINFTGNVIPANWFKHITYENGKPNLNAIVILSEVVFWYRGIEVRDEATGELKGFYKKFKEDKLQRSYESLANQFGLSKIQVKRAIDTLKDLGLINVEFRNIESKDGRVIPNVMYIEPVPERIREITFEEVNISLLKSKDIPTSKLGYANFEVKTNTEITTEITNKNINNNPPEGGTNSQPSAGVVVNPQILEINELYKKITGRDKLSFFVSLSKMYQAEKIMSAVIYLKKAMIRGKIDNPEGFIISALKNKWDLEFIEPRTVDKKTPFHNSSERQYDMAELERKLLAYSRGELVSEEDENSEEEGIDFWFDDS